MNPACEINSRFIW